MDLDRYADSTVVASSLSCFAVAATRRREAEHFGGRLVSSTSATSKKIVQPEETPAALVHDACRESRFVSTPDLVPPKLATFMQPLACERFVEASPSAPVPRTANTAGEVAAIYRQHRHLVYRLALRYGKGNVAWAEDIMQEVFIDLLKALPTLDQRDNLAGWLYRATTHRCLWRMRKERFLTMAPVRWILGEKMAEPRPPDELAIARDDLRRAQDILSKLPSKEQVAFCMYYLDGKEQEEIAQLLGHSKGYVCKLIQRATESLEKAGWEVSP